MSDLLAIGASGIKAYSRALSTVGDNIANAQTPGYVRRQVRMEEATAAGDIVLSRNSIRPGGVLAAGVTRAVDEWLADDARIASGDAARSSAKLEWISATEGSLDDGADGIGTSLTAIFNTADQLTADPNSTTLRSQFLQAVDSSATAFRRTASALTSVASGVASEAQRAVQQLNTDLTALSRVNDGLRRARAGSTNEATLLDERDRLVTAVSTATNVTPSYGPRGTVSLQAPDGSVLLSGTITAQVAVATAANGTIAFSVNGAPLVPSSGSLAGLADAASHIAQQRSSLDALATQFAADLNAAHQSGVDAAGNPGAALLNLNGGAAMIAALALAPGDVASADAISSNGNMLALSGLRGSAGVEAGWAALVTAQSQTAAAARAKEAAASTRRDGAFAARDAVSAVDLDREAAELMRFQQAYEAAARTIQVARETMQTMLNIF
ncbi:flagellar hook-associated protein FlgK [Nostoc sp. HG1]|nr:flagellar hook-associated protein FlgK [Nostoc sp. HG1]